MHKIGRKACVILCYDGYWEGNFIKTYVEYSIDEDYASMLCDFSELIPGFSNFQASVAYLKNVCKK